MNTSSTGADGTHPDQPDLVTDRAGARRSAPGRDAGSRHVFDVAEMTFDLLTRDPAPLAVDGAVLGHGLPARVIALNELRALLLHPSTGPEARDAAWRELVCRARVQGAGWVMGCVGVALPGLKAIVRDRLRGLHDHGAAHTERTADPAAELVTEFYLAVLAVDLEKPRIAQRLLWRSAKAVQRTHQPYARVIPFPPQEMTEAVEAAQTRDAAVPPGGDLDALLDAAIRAGVLTATDAAIITATRLDGVPSPQFAARSGTSYAALMKRRRRAENRLVIALRQGDLRDDAAYLMSTISRGRSLTE